MQIKDIMTKNVISVAPDMNVSDVARILRQHKIHGIPVVDGKHLVGIITETDFFTKGDVEIYLPAYADFIAKTGMEENQKSDESGELNAILKAKAEDIMSKDCMTIHPDAEVREFIDLVKNKNIHTVPVAIGDILQGVVTVADIIKLI